MYVHAQFDQAPSTATKTTGQGRDNVTGYAKFDTSGNKVVTMRIATSFISADQAKKNLDLEVPQGTSFDTVENRAEQAWNAKLGKVEVQGASDDQLTTLYSDLYRMNLYPNSASENTGTAAQPVYQYASPFSTGRHQHPHPDRREDRGRQGLRQQRLLGHLPHRVARVLAAGVRTPPASWRTASSSSTRTAAGSPAGPRRATPT